MRNLAGDPKAKDIQVQLERRLRQWMEETEDPFDRGPRDPETGMLEMGQKFASEKWNR